MTESERFISQIENSKQSLYKVARSFFREEADAEDAISQTVLDAWEKRSTLKNPFYFKTWLIRILINNCKDMLRSRERLVCTEEIPETAAEDPDPGNLNFGSLMELLDERTRPVMTLYYAEGYKTSEIAKLLHMPRGTVTSCLKRGREKLTAALAEREGEF